MGPCERRADEQRHVAAKPSQADSPCAFPHAWISRGPPLAQTRACGLPAGLLPQTLAPVAPRAGRDGEDGGDGRGPALELRRLARSRTAVRRTDAAGSRGSPSGARSAGLLQHAGASRPQGNRLFASDSISCSTMQHSADSESPLFLACARRRTPRSHAWHEHGVHSAYGLVHATSRSFGQRDQPFGQGRSGGRLARERTRRDRSS